MGTVPWPNSFHEKEAWKMIFLGFGLVLHLLMHFLVYWLLYFYSLLKLCSWLMQIISSSKICLAWIVAFVEMV